VGDFSFISNMAETANSSLAAWVERIEPIDGELARRIGGESLNPYAVAAELGLPVPAYRKFDTIQVFLDGAEAGLRPLVDAGITSFYAGGRTNVSGLPGFRNNQPLAADEVAPFLLETVAPGDRDSYNLRVAEFLQGVCVVAQIRHDGTIDLDIGKDTTLPKLTGGLKTPDFMATNQRDEDNPMGVLRYFARVRDAEKRLVLIPLGRDIESPVLNTSVRTAIWSAISKLPAMAVESDVYVPRLPGRYEFAVVNHRGIDTGIFGDAQPFTKLSVE
jgi:hypothetical protein